MNNIQRAKRVLASQGKSVLLATGSMAGRVDELAALCSESGVVSPDAPKAFERIWHQHTAEMDQQKATDADMET